MIHEIRDDMFGSLMIESNRKKILENHSKLKKIYLIHRNINPLTATEKELRNYASLIKEIFEQ